MTPKLSLPLTLCISFSWEISCSHAMVSSPQAIHRQRSYFYSYDDPSNFI